MDCAERVLLCVAWCGRTHVEVEICSLLVHVHIRDVSASHVRALDEFERDGVDALGLVAGLVPECVEEELRLLAERLLAGDGERLQRLGVEGLGERRGSHADVWMGCVWVWVGLFEMRGVCVGSCVSCGTVCVGRQRRHSSASARQIWKILLPAARVLKTRGKTSTIASENEFTRAWD